MFVCSVIFEKKNSKHLNGTVGANGGTPINLPDQVNDPSNEDIMSSINQLRQLVYAEKNSYMFLWHAILLSIAALKLETSSFAFATSMKTISTYWSTKDAAAINLFVEKNKTVFLQSAGAYFLFLHISKGLGRPPKQLEVGASSIAAAIP